MTPDPQRDVMVYQVEMVDALGGGSIGDRWTVWAGSESAGSFESEGDAVIAAVQLASEHRRPAWLVKDGAAPIAL